MDWSPLNSQSADGEGTPSSRRTHYCCGCRCCGDGLRATSISITILSLVLIALYTLVVWLPPYIHDQLVDGINEYVYFDPNDLTQEGYRTWSNSLDPDSQVVYFDVYVYNITNPNEAAAGQTIEVEEIGPFSFIQQTIRYDTSFGYDQFNQQYVRYLEWEYYTFNPQGSISATLDMKITSFNFAFSMTRALLGEKVQTECYEGVSNVERYFVSITVDSLLNGYLAQTGCWYLDIPVVGLLGNSTKLQADLSGYSEIFIGDASNFNYLTRAYKSWKGADLIVASKIFGTYVWGQGEKFPNGVSYNSFHGTDGTQFSTNIQLNQSLVAFVEGLNRPVAIRNVNNEQIEYEGITLYRFRLDKQQLVNVTQNPLNLPYYSMHYNGFLNLSTAYFDIPIFVSQPHFLSVDDFVRKNIAGIPPITDSEQYETVIDVEPITGATMQAHKRIQINIQFNKGNFTSPINDVDVFIPLMWTDEHGAISSSKADDFKSQVYLAVNFEKYFVIVGYAMSVVLAVVIVFLHWNIGYRMRWMTFHSSMKAKLEVDS